MLQMFQGFQVSFYVVEYQWLLYFFCFVEFVQGIVVEQVVVLYVVENYVIVVVVVGFYDLQVMLWFQFQLFVVGYCVNWQSVLGIGFG